MTYPCKHGVLNYCGVCEVVDKLTKPRTKYGTICFCGFIGNTRNIVAHRQACSTWQDRARQEREDKQSARAIRKTVQFR